MGMIKYAKTGREMARVFSLLTATVGMIAILPISAESADDLRPPVGYRRWFHVNTMIVDKSRLRRRLRPQLRRAGRNQRMGAE